MYGDVKSKTVSYREMARQDRRRQRDGLQLVEEYHGPRPQTRGDCVGGFRPCPWVACRYNLFLSIRGGSSLQHNFGEDVDGFDHMADTCALDVADRGGVTLEETAVRLNVVRERIRQEEMVALEKMKQALVESLAEEAEHVGGSSVPDKILAVLPETKFDSHYSSIFEGQRNLGSGSKRRGP